ncbi:MAG: transcriptional regulator [Nostocaceae cyanobacterium]|nr:transcriptional regulator [Nostocaceae cyanobacterium]
MKNVQAPTSSSYQEYLISSLQSLKRAAGYISVALELEEEGREPELLRAMLKDVIDARVQAGNLSEAAKLHYEKLDKMIAATGGDEIYTLIELLDALGYVIAIAPKED